jgi:transcriptional regulator with XRE-family HTH domain
MMNIGDSLKVALARHDKPQSWLSEQMGCTQSYISRVMNGRANVSVRRAYQIAAIFGMNGAEFIALGDEIKDRG